MNEIRESHNRMKAVKAKLHEEKVYEFDGAQETLVLTAYDLDPELKQDEKGDGSEKTPKKKNLSIDLISPKSHSFSNSLDSTKSSSSSGRARSAGSRPPSAKRTEQTITITDADLASSRDAQDSPLDDKNHVLKRSLTSLESIEDTKEETAVIETEQPSSSTSNSTEGDKTSDVAPSLPATTPTPLADPVSTPSVASESISQPLPVSESTSASQTVSTISPLASPTNTTNSNVLPPIKSTSSKSPKSPKSSDDLVLISNDENNNEKTMKKHTATTILTIIWKEGHRTSHHLVLSPNTYEELQIGLNTVLGQLRNKRNYENEQQIKIQKENLLKLKSDEKSDENLNKNDILNSTQESQKDLKNSNNFSRFPAISSSNQSNPSNSSPILTSNESNPTESSTNLPSDQLNLTESSTILPYDPSSSVVSNDLLTISLNSLDHYTNKYIKNDYRTNILYKKHSYQLGVFVLQNIEGDRITPSNFYPRLQWFARETYLSLPPSNKFLRSLNVDWDQKEYYAAYKHP